MDETKASDMILFLSVLFKCFIIYIRGGSTIIKISIFIYKSYVNIMIFIKLKWKFQSCSIVRDCYWMDFDKFIIDNIMQVVFTLAWSVI